MAARIAGFSGISIFANPGRARTRSCVAEHVGQRHLADDGPTSRDAAYDGADEEPAIRAAMMPSWRGVVTGAGRDRRDGGKIVGRRAEMNFDRRIMQAGPNSPPPRILATAMAPPLAARAFPHSPNTRRLRNSNPP